MVEGLGVVVVQRQRLAQRRQVQRVVAVLRAGPGPEVLDGQGHHDVVDVHLAAAGAMLLEVLRGRARRGRVRTVVVVVMVVVVMHMVAVVVALRGLGDLGVQMPNP